MIPFHPCPRRWQRHREANGTSAAKVGSSTATLHTAGREHTPHARAWALLNTRTLTPNADTARKDKKNKRRVVVWPRGPEPVKRMCKMTRDDMVFLKRYRAPGVRHAFVENSRPTNVAARTRQYFWLVFSLNVGELPVWELTTQVWYVRQHYRPSQQIFQ